MGVDRGGEVQVDGCRHWTGGVDTGLGVWTLDRG